MTTSSSPSNQEGLCVWVMAGVLNYRRPCHRNFECEECELFHALQGVGMGGSEELELGGDTVVSAYIAQLMEGCDLHLDRHYTPGHFWIKEEAPDEVILGFDGQTLRILFPLDDLLLPKAGYWIKRGEPLGWLLRGHLTLPLPSPISGEVQEVNDTLVEEIRGAGSPRSQNGWLLRMRPHEALGGTPGLLEGESLLAWYRLKLGLVRSYLRAATDTGLDAGVTLNDGGELNRNLEEVLGTHQFRELVDRLFHNLV